jgi:MHS family alpha-ketoglutarate permease-like MFS transporter
MLCFGVLVTVFTVPILSALQNVSSPYAAFALVICALLIVSFYTSISGILKAEMFPAQVRALGLDSLYAVANALFGGSAEYVALSLKSAGIEHAFYWYVTVMGAIAFLVSLMLHRKGKGYVCSITDAPAAIPHSRWWRRPHPRRNLSSSSRSLPGGCPIALSMPLS